MDWTTFLLTKAGSVFLMVIMGGGIALFLRFLFGPGGRLRDPKWDAANDENHRTQGTPPPWLLAHKRAFERYAKSFHPKNSDMGSHMALKEAHTMRVLENAMHIARHEPAFAPPQIYRAFLLGALYHDVGRFQQLLRFNTFSDLHSCNHGHLGAMELHRNGFLSTEPPAVRRMARTAVCLHNAYTLPPHLPHAHSILLHGVRDADKLDIIHIMCQQLGPGAQPDETVVMHLQNVPEPPSPVIWQAFCQRTPASFKDMRIVNDFRILLCTWFDGLHYPTSQKKLAESGNLVTILQGMQGAEAIQQSAIATIKERQATVLSV